MEGKGLIELRKVYSQGGLLGSILADCVNAGVQAGGSTFRGEALTSEGSYEGGPCSYHDEAKVASSSCNSLKLVCAKGPREST